MNWFISDSHYSHRNICRGTSQWKRGYRNFDTLDAMNNCIVDSINAVVAPNDTLRHLGDWSFGGIEQVKQFRDRINCKNIQLLLGNHDHHIMVDKKNELRKLFDKVYYSFWSGSIEGQMMTLCHYNLNVWDKSHHGAWHLYGHSHSSLPDDLNSMSLEVGMDCMYGIEKDRENTLFTKCSSTGEKACYFYGNDQSNPELYFRNVDFDNFKILHTPFAPFSMDSISDILKTYKTWNQMDHHDKETN